MNKPITRELLENLRAEGYTMLIAEDQADQEFYEFTPHKHDVEKFSNDHITSDLEDDMILVIDEVLTYFKPEDFVGHSVVEWN